MHKPLWAGSAEKGGYSSCFDTIHESPGTQKDIKRDAHTPQPGEIVFNTIKTEMKQFKDQGYIQSKQCQLCKGQNSISVEKIMFKRSKIYALYYVLSKLSKSVSTYFCDKRNMPQIWQVNTLWQSQG